MSLFDTYLPISKLVAIESISVIFDGMLAVFAYLIIEHKYRRMLPALLGALAILFAPTIFVNSAAWGQCDAIYTAFCLGSLYFLLRRILRHRSRTIHHYPKSHSRYNPCARDKSTASALDQLMLYSS